MSAINPIAHIQSPYNEKFGIPRQSGLAADVYSTIIFEPEYRHPDALRGIEQFDYLWLIWQFSENADHPWSPTVRPPRLGGNTRLGVFATRSSFRPNALGLSSVRLLSVSTSPVYGSVLHVAGADLMDGTPIFDIKPYIPYSDSHPDARAGYASQPPRKLTVSCPDHIASTIADAVRNELFQVLAFDPRPSYHDAPGRIYGFKFYDYNVRFSVDADDILHIVSIS